MTGALVRGYGPFVPNEPYDRNLDAEMTMLNYDQGLLMSRLDRLGREEKTAFAASSAQRILPLFGKYARLRDDPRLFELLANALDLTWQALADPQTEVNAVAEQAETLVPDSEDNWTLEAGYAQNAAAAVAYAARTWIHDSSQDAAWAALQVYETADLASVQQDRVLNLGAPHDDAKVLRSELVQQALAGIEADIRFVEETHGTWPGLRERAEAFGTYYVLQVP